MKVYVLHYQCYDESEIHGVYSEKAMKKELEHYAECGRKRNDKAIEDQKARLAELNKLRKSLGQEDRRLSEEQARLKANGETNVRIRFKSQRKDIARKMNQLAVEIESKEIVIKQMSSMTNEQLAKKELDRLHLSFEEFDVLR